MYENERKEGKKEDKWNEFNKIIFTYKYPKGNFTFVYVEERNFYRTEKGEWQGGVGLEIKFLACMILPK